MATISSFSPFTLKLFPFAFKSAFCFLFTLIWHIFSLLCHRHVFPVHFGMDIFSPSLSYVKFMIFDEKDQVIWFPQFEDLSNGISPSDRLKPFLPLGFLILWASPNLNSSLHHPVLSLHHQYRRVNIKHQFIITSHFSIDIQACGLLLLKEVKL